MSLLTNEGHPYFNQMGAILILPMAVHNNESSMANILSFAEVDNIEGMHINMESPKEKVINVHIKDGKLFISKHMRGVFSKQILITQV